MTDKGTDDAIIISETSVETIYQQDKAIVDVQIATAKLYPRSIKKATENAMVIVTIDQATASTCTYGVPRGGKTIQGPSVHLAKILAQTWGNMRVEAKVIAVDGKTLTSQGIAFDLENNLAIKVEVKRSIMTKTGRMNDDMIVVTGNAANSIAMRNAILSVIPKQVVDKVYTTAKQMITGDISDALKLTARRKQVVLAMVEAYKITEGEIIKAINRASVEHIDSDDIVALIGIGQAIKDGDTTVELAFKGGKSEKSTGITKEELETIFKLKREFLSPDIEIDIERIINNSEVLSYTKAHNILKQL